MQDDLRIRFQTLELAYATDVIDMRMSQSDRLQSETEAIESRSDPPRTSRISGIDHDGAARPFTGDDPRVLLKGCDDESFDDHFRIAKSLRRVFCGA